MYSVHSHVGSAAVECQRKIKSHLKKKFKCVSEGLPKAGERTGLNDFSQRSSSQREAVERSTRNMRSD